jgi:uncharacterized protein with HEPN domain
MSNLYNLLEEILINQRKSIINNDIENLERLSNEAKGILQKLKDKKEDIEPEKARKLRDELIKNIDILNFTSNITNGIIETIKKEQIIRSSATCIKRV